MFDVDWMKGQSAGLYTLKNSAPEDVIKELQNVFEADGPGKGHGALPGDHAPQCDSRPDQEVEVPG